MSVIRREVNNYINIHCFINQYINRIILQILATFKKLHRTSQFVFQEDNYAINAARIKINEEFKKNKEAEDSVKQLKLANDVINELKTNIVQAKKEESGHYSKLYLFG